MIRNCIHIATLGLAGLATAVLGFNDYPQAEGSWKLFNPDTINITQAHALWFVDDTTGFAAGEVGGLFQDDSGTIAKTLDGGKSWETVYLDAATTRINDLFFRSPDTGVAVGSDGVILGTLDGGESWDVLTSNTEKNLQAIDFDPTITTGYIAGIDVVCKSTDGGLTWDTLSLDHSGLIADVVCVDEDTVYAVDDDFLFLASVDGGENWTVDTLGADKEYNWAAGAEAIHFVDGQVGFVGINGSNSNYDERDLYATTDGGANWTRIEFPRYGDEFWSGFKAIAFPNDTFGVLLCDDGLLFTTSDAGATWDTVVAVDALGSEYIWESMSFVGQDLAYAISADGYLVRYTAKKDKADFAADVMFGEAPLTVTFTDKTSGSPDGWAWDFDNDGTVDATTQNPEYTYQDPGVYTVTLIAVDGEDSLSRTYEDLVVAHSGADQEKDVDIVTDADSYSNSVDPLDMDVFASFGQAVYTAAEIGEAGAIHSIALFQRKELTGGYTFENTCVRLKHTEATELESASPDFSGACYFSADLEVSEAEGWVTLELDRPFVYNGTDNLHVCVSFSSTTDSDFSFAVWRGHETDASLYSEGGKGTVTGSWDAELESAKRMDIRFGLQTYSLETVSLVHAQPTGPARSWCALAGSRTGTAPAFVRYGVPAAGHVRIDLYTCAGRLVNSLVNGVRTPGVHSVGLSGLGAGAYVIRMRTADQVLQNRFMVQ